MKHFFAALLILAALFIGTAYAQQQFSQALSSQCWNFDNVPTSPTDGTWVYNSQCTQSLNLGFVDARGFKTLNAAQVTAALQGLQIKVFEYIPLGAPLTTSVPISVESSGVVDTKGYALTISAPWCDKMASASSPIIGTGAITWNVSDCGGFYSFIDSIVNSSGSVSLINDSASPGNSMVYGTNSSGVKGWQTGGSGCSGGVCSGSELDLTDISGAGDNAKLQNYQGQIHLLTQSANISGGYTPSPSNDWNNPAKHYAFLPSSIFDLGEFHAYGPGYFLVGDHSPITGTSINDMALAVWDHVMTHDVSGCTASGVPWSCCTGSGSGTCSSVDWAGWFEAQDYSSLADSMMFGTVSGATQAHQSEVLGTDGLSYSCILGYTPSDTTTQPPSGVNAHLYWCSAAPGNILYSSTCNNGSGDMVWTIGTQYHASGYGVGELFGLTGFASAWGTPSLMVGTTGEIEVGSDLWDTLGGGIAVATYSPILAYKSDNETPVSTGTMIGNSIPKIVGGAIQVGQQMYDPLILQTAVSQVMGSDGHVYDNISAYQPTNTTTAPVSGGSYATYWTRHKNTQGGYTDSGQNPLPFVIGSLYTPGGAVVQLQSDSYQTGSFTQTGLIHALVNGIDVGIPFGAWTGPVFAGQLMNSPMVSNQWAFAAGNGSGAGGFSISGGVLTLAPYAGGSSTAIATQAMKWPVAGRTYTVSIDVTALVDTVAPIVISGLANGGTGYAQYDVFWITQAGAANGEFVVDSVNGSGTILTCHMANGGTGYSVANNLPTTTNSTHGSGALMNIIEVGPGYLVYTLGGTQGVPISTITTNTQNITAVNNKPLDIFSTDGTTTATVTSISIVLQ